MIEKWNRRQCRHDLVNTIQLWLWNQEKGDVIMMKGYVTNGQPSLEIMFGGVAHGECMSRQPFEDKDSHDFLPTDNCTPTKTRRNHKKKARLFWASQIIKMTLL